MGHFPNQRVPETFPKRVKQGVGSQQQNGRAQNKTAKKHPSNTGIIIRHGGVGERGEREGVVGEGRRRRRRGRRRRRRVGEREGGWLKWIVDKEAMAASKNASPKAREEGHLVGTVNSSFRVTEGGWPGSRRAHAHQEEEEKKKKTRHEIIPTKPVSNVTPGKAERQAARQAAKSPRGERKKRGGAKTASRQQENKPAPVKRERQNNV